MYLPNEEDLAWLSDEDAARYRRDVNRLSKPPMIKKVLQQVLLWLLMWPLSWLNELGRTPKQDNK